jgi:phosphoglycolate phosphatase-like HAD superfamily hydrolase
MDGVLIDSIQLAYAFTKQDHPGLAWDEFQGVYEDHVFDGIKKIKHKQRQLPDEDRQQKRSAYTVIKKFSPTYDGIPELVASLSQDFILAVNTSASDANTHQVLQMAGIDQYFNYVATKDVSYSKTKKTQMILEKYGVNPDQAIFITDTLGDVTQVAPTGVKSIGVTWGIHDDFHFQSAPTGSIFKVVSNTQELAGALLEYFA